MILLARDFDNIIIRINYSYPSREDMLDVMAEVSTLIDGIRIEIVEDVV